jgi:hypothetical protein
MVLGGIPLLFKTFQECPRDLPTASTASGECGRARIRPSPRGTDDGSRLRHSQCRNRHVCANGDFATITSHCRTTRKGNKACRTVTSRDCNSFIDDQGRCLHLIHRQGLQSLHDPGLLQYQARVLRLHSKWRSRSTCMGVRRDCRMPKIAGAHPIPNFSSIDFR